MERLDRIPIRKRLGTEEYAKKKKPKKDGKKGKNIYQPIKE